MKFCGFIAALVSAVFVVGCSKPTEQKKDPNQVDMQRLQGTWVLESGVGNGKPFRSELLGKVKLTVSGDRYSITGGKGPGTSGSGTFKLDATKSPKQVDLMATDGEDAGKVYLGIYEIDGDMQRGCFASPDEPRPTKFASEPNSKMLLQVWKHAGETMP